METLGQATYVELYRARLSDMAQLLELIKAYYRFDHITFNAKSVREALRELLRDCSLGIVWIMRDAEKAVGYIVLTFNYDLEFGGLEGLITDLFIRSEYRSHGLGRRA
ncbi:MAG: GNAT family N-acetyltransferase, partial [Candidatus Binataceae bacterium]